MRYPFLLAATLALAACDRSVLPEPEGEAAPAPRTQVSVSRPSSAPLNALPPREALSDPAITGRIKSAILSDPAMGGADISVNTDHGVVSLNGIVKTPEQTAIASAHAQRQDGVVRVDSHLSITAP